MNGGRPTVPLFGVPLLAHADLTVHACAAFHDWLGRGETLEPMHDAWAAGDRKGAAAALPDHVVDDLASLGPVH